jgi:hypothetical protein
MKNESPDLIKARERKFFNKEEVENWVGVDNLDADYLLDLLTDLINEAYTIENFRLDVEEHNEEK